MRFIVVEKFPLMFAKHFTQNKERKRGWKRETLKEWDGVRLVKMKSGWGLNYGGEFSTGPFKSRAAAIGWFIKGGR